MNIGDNLNRLATGRTLPLKKVDSILTKVVL